MLNQVIQYKRIIMALLMLILSACQTVPKDDLEVFNHNDFEKHYQQRLNESTWSLKGVFSFSNEDEDVQGKVFWDQASDNAKIKLLGPLGAGSVKLSLRPGVASMQQGKKTFTAPSADELMLQVLGWKMPLDSINYWLYGLAAPEQGARYRLGEKGEVIELKQSGWLIRFKQYRQVEGFSMLMPRKIFASHVKTKTDVRLVVTKMSR